MSISTKIKRWWRNIWERLYPYRKLLIIESDSLPDDMPKRDIILASENGEDWCVGMRCPCGCGYVIELLVVAEAKPRWSVVVDARGRPTLTPSIWMQKGCRSHFWVREGRVHWC